MPLSTFTYGGKEYEFDSHRDMSVSRLRHIKQWYKAMGTSRAFLEASSLGDPDALACIVWIARTKAGESCPEPPRCEDFPMGEVLESFVTDGVALGRLFISPMRFEVDGDAYSFDYRTQLTLKRMRYVKQRFEEIGTLVTFMAAFLAGDPDAAACVWRFVRIDSGEAEEEVPDPRWIEDFSVAEVTSSFSADQEVLEEVAESLLRRLTPTEEEAGGLDPTEGHTTPSSTKTSTSSATSSRSSSRTPATSTQRPKGGSRSSRSSAPASSSGTTGPSS